MKFLGTEIMRENLGLHDVIYTIAHREYTAYHEKKHKMNSIL